jgi:hypothetical protein
MITPHEVPAVNFVAKATLQIPTEKAAPTPTTAKNKKYRNNSRIQI